jgi:hypothetical protein
MRTPPEFSDRFLIHYTSHEAERFKFILICYDGGIGDRNRLVKISGLITPGKQYLYCITIQPALIIKKQ